ncbi:MAG: DUF2075 domain-containing protein [Acidobacteria bacterium]|nr:DUF2075 domain-containing protein [Acidobacteriota bacterium]
MENVPVLPTSSSSIPPLSNSYYSADVAALIRATPEEIIGALITNSNFSVELAQRNAWLLQITVLKSALVGVEGTLFLEFVVPRIGSRLDAVLIAGNVIFAIEFKIGESEYHRADLNQVWDYSLDLKNFHKGSQEAPIIPILVATESHWSDTALPMPHPDGVYPPSRSNADGLAQLIKEGLSHATEKPLDAIAWASSPYQPTPTIIEAAQALYSQHSVEAIARHDAGARNLTVTSQRVEELIDEARQCGRKIIVFVTGVPGAGKTLVGLNVATKKRNEEQPTHAVFLSGNGPLVAVLREALTRDEITRLREKGVSTRRGVIGQPIKAFIQNVHHFRDEGLRLQAPPVDHVVIFDEAQRAWNKRKTADFMLRRKKRPGFSQSEPEFLISYLDRHIDWAVVICLVGGGQEINDGEAGISAWLDAVREKFPDWHAYISPNLTDSEYAAGHALETIAGSAIVVQDEKLHLAVSMRSFRAESVSQFVKAVLDCEDSTASELLTQISKRYPIALTRDLQLAKQWIRDHARGSERFGMVASSGAQRLKPHAIDVRVEINPVHWFLNTSDDTRSSWYLEDAATEFQVQGLELDWVCMTWDADLRFAQSGWSCNEFRGSKWTSIHKLDRQQYLRNAYRVLLTRARQGMVIFVPPGDSIDATRAPAYYDSTFRYLLELGLPVLEPALER